MLIHISNKKGFTLIELLIVVAIIGIIATIAIPNLLTALQKSRQKSTMGDLSSVGKAIESYLTDNGFPPQDTFSNLQPCLEPFHIKKMPQVDSWGFVFQYDYVDDIYSVGSGGRDGSVVDWNQSGVYYCLTIADFVNDIIYSNGQFAYYPKTK